MTMRLLYFMLVMVLFPSCMTVATVKRYDSAGSVVQMSRVLTSGDMGIVTTETSGDNRANLFGSLSGDVGGLAATKSIEKSNPGSIIAGEITMTGVDHSPGIREGWIGINRLVRNIVTGQVIKSMVGGITDVHTATQVTDRTAIKAGVVKSGIAADAAVERAAIRALTIKQ